ncbi:hypothetical protein E2562_015120 [Oryza meyeriana var. granulata]|uniref:Uncharacterized protein n=1 Tax=Oryza meyeriana var. granulata TaxID=110450 RepID=A0A6G1DWV3_9ORYZ|nr:hypothetical protein E2562_015120 [Oryza meyeriana var. granulata]
MRWSQARMGSEVVGAATEKVRHGGRRCNYFHGGGSSDNDDDEDNTAASSDVAVSLCVAGHNAAVYISRSS